MPPSIDQHLLKDEIVEWRVGRDAQLVDKNNRKHFWFTIIVIIPLLSWYIYHNATAMIPAFIDGTIFSRWWATPLLIIILLACFWAIDHHIKNIRSNPDIPPAHYLYITNKRLISTDLEGNLVQEMSLNLAGDLKTGSWQGAKNTLRVYTLFDEYKDAPFWFPFLENPTKVLLKVDEAKRRARRS